MNDEDEVEGSERNSESVRIFSPGVVEASSIVTSRSECVDSRFEEMDETGRYREISKSVDSRKKLDLLTP